MLKVLRLHLCNFKSVGVQHLASRFLLATLLIIIILLVCILLTHGTGGIVSPGAGTGLRFSGARQYH